MNTCQKMLMCAAALAVSSHAPVAAHAILEKSVPGKDAVLDTAPPAIMLQFNEKLEPAFSSMQVIDTAGQNVMKEKPALDPADHSVLRGNLRTLEPGTYTVKWAAVGHDGHPRKGQYMFSVK